MTVSPSKAALLRDVAEACRISMAKDHRRESRAKAMREIATDPRLHSKARHTQTSLVEDVMATLQVSRVNARKIIHLARRVNQ